MPFVGSRLVLYESVLTTQGPRYEARLTLELGRVMGCLTAPFKVLGCLGLVALLAIGWLYRDRVVREGRRLLGRVESPRRRAGAPRPAGGPGTRALASADARRSTRSTAGAPIRSSSRRPRWPR